MPINSYKMGPGTLTLGAAPLDVSCQVAAARVVPTENVDTLDAVPMLCGDDLPQEQNASVTWQLTGTFQQDIALGGVVAYTWDESGAEVPFTLVPNTAAARQVTGKVRIVPLIVGGDVKTRPASDFTWSIIGAPVLGAVA
jgi:hypothetical protein